MASSLTTAVNPIRRCGVNLANTVDQAAEYMNEPEGEFIWALPGIAERQKTFRDRALKLLELPKGAILGAHAVVALRGADYVAELLSHPEFGSDAFVEAMRMTYAQILAATVIERYPIPIKRLDY